MFGFDAFILNWQATNPISYGIFYGMIVGAGIVGMIWLQVDTRKREDEKRRAERAAKRAEIKANGGL